MVLELVTSVSSILFSLLGITFIISFHELGHLLFAKLFNVYAPTFSIGMGKKIFSKKNLATPTFAYQQHLSEDTLKSLQKKENLAHLDSIKFHIGKNSSSHSVAFSSISF